MKQTAIKAKPWTKPELIVLARSQPEECVLSACKMAGGGGNRSYDDYCYDSPSCSDPCNAGAAS